MNKAVVAARHGICGILAAVLVAGGWVRRATRRLREQDRIVSIYFHNPSARLFERCAGWLRAQGFDLIPERRLLDALRGEETFPRACAWISLDDGYREWMDHVLRVARTQNVPVTLFIPSGIVEGDGRFPWMRKSGNARHALTVADLKHIAGWEQISIGGHTVTHPVMPRCTEEELATETTSCKRSLDAWTGREVVTFAYPRGQRSGRERRHLAAAGFQLAATTEPRFIRPGDDPFAIPRVCIPDGITFPEAMCRMAGVWDPLTGAVKAVLGFGGTAAGAAPQYSPQLAGGQGGPGDAV